MNSNNRLSTGGVALSILPEPIGSISFTREDNKVLPVVHLLPKPNPLRLEVDEVLRQTANEERLVYAAMGVSGAATVAIALARACF